MPSELRRDTVKLGTLLSIAEQIQAFGLGRKTGEICIINAPAPARLSILEGEVVDAQFGLRSGLEAAVALINFVDPQSEFIVGEKPQRRSIEMPYMQLLCEAALGADEALSRKTKAALALAKGAPLHPFLCVTIAGELMAFAIPSGATMIGRATSNDIVISEPTVSQQHATIEFSGEGILLKDHGSSNGTCVAGQRIKEQWLKTRDSLQFGSVHCLFIAGPGKTASAA